MTSLTTVLSSAGSKAVWDWCPIIPLFEKIYMSLGAQGPVVCVVGKTVLVIGQ